MSEFSEDFDDRADQAVSDETIRRLKAEVEHLAGERDEWRHFCRKAEAEVERQARAERAEAALRDLLDAVAAFGEFVLEKGASVATPLAVAGGLAAIDRMKAAVINARAALREEG